MSSLVITKQLRQRIVAGLTAFLLIGVVIGNVVDSNDDSAMSEALVGSELAEGESGSASDELAAGSDLPTTAFELFDGGSTTFAEFQDGRPLIINFWASWCPACVAELPEFQEAHAEYGDEIAFIGMANADPREAAVALADEVGLTYALADDPAGDLFRELELLAMPSTIFVTPSGEIIESFGGQLVGQALTDRIEQLLEAS